MAEKEERLTRRVAGLLAAALIAASWPVSARAQFARAARPLPLKGPSLALPAPPVAPLPAFAASALPPSLVPMSVLATPSPAVAPAAPAAPALAVSIVAANALHAALPRVEAAAAPAAAAESFALLTLDAPVRRADLVAAPASAEGPAPLPPARGPAPKRPDADAGVRRMMIGTSVMKAGMESIKLGMPLLALQAFGGVSAVAGLIVVHGLAQAAFAGMAGGLADRFSAKKVLAGAVALQAGLVLALVGVGAAGALSAATMIPLYLLIGGVTGVIETTRHSIPALVIGQDEEALKKYNAKLHIWYEVAGVAGALAAGAMLAGVGPVWALLVMPPAYLAAAWYFSRVNHARPEVPAFARAGGALAGAAAKVRAYFADLKAGAKLVSGDPRLRWVAAAFVLPQIVHRVFEDLLIPVFAKKVLEAPETSAWMITASNMGELIGAAVLLKLATRFPGAGPWVKWGAIGLALIWALALSTSLPLILPLILLSSATWSASDLSLRSDLQKSVAEKDQPRALSFLYGTFVVGGALVSLAFGAFLDALPLMTAIAWICALFSALGAGVWWASRRVGAVKA